MSGNVDDIRNVPPTVVGRTPYDAASELFQLLGRALPYVTVLGIIIYAFIEVSKSYQEGRIAAAQEYATRVEALNKLQESAFTGIELLRASQLQTIEKMSALNAVVVDSIARNQEALSQAREEIERQKAKQQEAEDKLREALRQQAELDRKRIAQDQELKAGEARLLAAENTIDIANRLTTFVTTMGLDAPVELKRQYLSRIFESATADAIRRDASGMLYYGIYRITGTDMARFMNYLQQSFPHYYTRLVEAGGAPAAKSGNDSFRYEWISLSREREFGVAQDAYLEATYYTPLVNKINATLRTRPGQSPDYDITKGSVAISAVLWSIAVQHGVAPRVAIRALDGVNINTAGPDKIIIAIYTERGQTERYFPNENDETKRMLAARYVFEEQVALKMSALERR